jgi:hypothetical protein
MAFKVDDARTSRKLILAILTGNKDEMTIHG